MALLSCHPNQPEYMRSCPLLSPALFGPAKHLFAASPHHPLAFSSLLCHHRLNYFLIDRGPNSAMGSKVEGFRGELVLQVPSDNTSLRLSQRGLRL